MLFVASAAEAAPKAAWQIAQNVSPTYLQPGTEAEPGEAKASAPVLVVEVHNVGGTVAVPNIEVVDTLPADLTVSSGSVPELYYDDETRSEVSVPCTALNQIISCNVPAEQYVGAILTLYIPLAVNAGSTGALPNAVEVSSPETKSATNAFDVPISEGLPPFGFTEATNGLRASAYDEMGESPVAGSHPFSMVLTSEVPVVQREADGALLPLQAQKSLNFSLPSGLVVNPRATPVRCTRLQFEGETRSPPQTCPTESQVGVIDLNILGFGEFPEPLYNLVPEANIPAELGFSVLNTQVRVKGGLDGSFHLTAGSTELLSKYRIVAVRTELWGNPSDEAHDPTRSGQNCARLGCPVGRTSEPFLTMPSACSSNLPFSATVTGWLGASASASRSFTDATGATEAVQGCERLSFEPTVSISPESTTTETPTGLSVDIKVPQTRGRYGLASATLKKAVVQLPEGMSVNPPAANGLSACSSAQIGLGNTQPAGCPASSKVGTAEIVTPLLEQPLNGSIYIAEQRNNPFGTLLALYLVVEGDGIVIKLAGRVDADLSNGQVTATFDNNPQLPFSELRVQFNGGNGASRAPLVTPPACGTYSIRTELTSWASAEPIALTNPYTVNSGCGTGGFNPGLSGGTANPSGGLYSAFTLRVTRADGEQNLSRISATLPEGLLAKLSGVPLCATAQATTGSCPTSSRIGSTTVGAGAGSQPLFIPQPGKTPTSVFLSGPYEGAPYSMVIEVPAQAGPFDLGNVVVRAALNVDPNTTQVTASSDPLPQILEGIPIAYRDVRVAVDRSNFIVNPTDCNPMDITSTLTSSKGAIAHPSARFQAAGCAVLGFNPSLKLSLKGGTKRTGHPGLKAVLTYPKGGPFANIARAQVNLPHSVFLEQNNLNKTCTRPVLVEGNCPKTTVYGHAEAYSPLLEKPLHGPVYLVGGFGYKLPALVAELNGQIRVLVKGKVDSGPNNGIRNTFEAVPDAPVSRFVLELKGGKKYGLLINSENICHSQQRAIVRFTAQNGKVKQFKPVINASCSDAKAKTHKKAAKN